MDISDNEIDSFDNELAALELPMDGDMEKLSNNLSTSQQKPIAASDEIKSKSDNSDNSTGTTTKSSETIPSAAEQTTTTAISTNPQRLLIKDSRSHSILVNRKQRGNPILKSIINVPWEFDEIVPDYIVGRTACVLFLSLRYHNFNPDYIHGRLKLLGKKFELRILLVQIDIKEPHRALKHLTRMCFLADLTLMLAWNAEEAGKILETYKLFENKTPDLIMERAEQYPHQKLVGALTNIKPVNKTDAMTLLQNFGSLANIINSTEERLSHCPGLGPRKAKKLYKTFNDSFLSN